MKVKITRFQQGSATVAQAIAADQLDLAEEMGGPDNVLRLAQKGAKIKMVAALQTMDPTWLYAKPGIKSVAELKGKTVVIGGFGGPVWTFGALMLTKGGLTLHDFKIIQNGNDAQRLGLLESGRAAASVISIPAAFLAQQHGFHSILYDGNVIKNDMEPWVANDAAIKNDPEGIVRFLRGIHEAETYIHQNPSAAAKVYAKLTKSNANFALRSVKIFSPFYTLKFNMAELQYVFKFDRKVGLWKGPIPPASELRHYSNESLLKQALSTS